MAEQAIVTSNALSWNALTSNALTSNALTSNALTSNALTSNALTSNALTSNALTSDALGLDVIKYIVSCALPAGKQLSIEVGGTSYSFEGELGLAPTWGDPGGSCDAKCRMWVSGCMLSRVNYFGEPVAISLRGTKLASDAAEWETYSVREGAYYGDVFASPPRYHACLSPGQEGLVRVCGPSLDACALDVVGSCEDACDAPREDGSFPDCRDRTKNPGGKFPRDATAFVGTVTAFLP